jgi:hypothetical protein
MKNLRIALLSLLSGCKEGVIKEVNSDFKYTNKIDVLVQNVRLFLINFLAILHYPVFCTIFIIPFHVKRKTKYLFN